MILLKANCQGAEDDVGIVIGKEASKGLGKDEAFGFTGSE